MTERPQTEHDSQAVPSPGQVLKAKREELDCSVEEAANALHLGRHVIEALERDDYAALPGSTFVQGYVRSYARLLSLDPERLVHSLAIQPETIANIQGILVTPRNTSRKKILRPRRKPSWKRRLFRVLALILLAGVVGSVVLSFRFSVSEISSMLSDWIGFRQLTDQIQTPLPQDEEYRPTPVTPSALSVGSGADDVNAAQSGTIRLE